MSEGDLMAAMDRHSRLLLFSLVLCIAIFVGCSDDEEPAEPEYDIQRLSAVWGTSEGNVYVAGKTNGPRGIILEGKGGSWTTVWTEQQDSPDRVCPYCYDIEDLWVADTGELFGAGAPGAIVQGNLSEINVTVCGWDAPDEIDFFYDVYGSSNEDVWAVGDFGTVAKYDGERWLRLDPGVSDHLLGVWGSGPENVYVSGWGGTVLRYDGANWISEEVPTDEDLSRIRGLSVEDIYVVGQEGGILHKNADGWSLEMKFENMLLFDIFPFPDGTVFATGVDDTTGWVLAKIDGSWQRYEDLGDVSMVSIWGSAPDDIYLAGSNRWHESTTTLRGLVIHYDGKTWSQVYTMGEEKSGVQGRGIFAP